MDIYDYLKENNMTMKSLAEKADVHPVYLGVIASGKKAASEKFCKKILKATNGKVNLLSPCSQEIMKQSKGRLFLYDNTMSFAEKGLMGFILMKKDSSIIEHEKSVRIRLNDLLDIECSDNAEMILYALESLIERGYVVKSRSSGVTYYTFFSESQK